MQVQLELPDFPARLGWETPLSDEDFERAAMASECIQLERSKEGDLIVNAPAGGATGHGNSEIIYQLRAWWKTHKLGWVFDSSTGFFLEDGSSYSPDAAYATVQQIASILNDNSPASRAYAQLSSSSLSLLRTVAKPSKPKCRIGSITGPRWHGSEIHIRNLSPSMNPASSPSRPKKRSFTALGQLLASI